MFKTQLLIMSSYFHLPVFVKNKHKELEMRLRGSLAIADLPSSLSEEAREHLSGLLSTMWHRAGDFKGKKRKAFSNAFQTFHAPVSGTLQKNQAEHAAPPPPPPSKLASGDAMTRPCGELSGGTRPAVRAGVLPPLGHSQPAQDCPRKDGFQG